METTTQEKEQTAVSGKKKRKQKWVGNVLKFLMYGGWLLVLGAGLTTLILISRCGK
jgi:hypothetical protein